MKKIRVCIVVNELLRGGAQRIILDIAKGIDANRFTLHVLYLKSHSNFGTRLQTVVQEIQDTNTVVSSLEGKKAFALRDVSALVVFLRKEQIDVVHTFLPYASILGRIAGWWTHIPVLSTQCNLPNMYPLHIRILDFCTRWMCSAWTGATEAIEEAYSNSVAPFSLIQWKRGRRHFTVVAGVDVPTFDTQMQQTDTTALRDSLHIPQSATVLMMTARLVAWKGHADLVDAVALLKESVHLILVGWGPEEQALRARVLELGLQDRVHFLGQRGDIPALLAIADVYVQTHCRGADGSIWKGPNTSQMEACALRVPSVSTAVPMVETLIEEGVTGMLAEPNNPSDLARAIAYLLEHPNEASDMAEAARTRVVQRFSIDAMVEAYQDLYTLCDGNNSN